MKDNYVVFSHKFRHMKQNWTLNWNSSLTFSKLCLYIFIIIIITRQTKNFPKYKYAKSRLQQSGFDFFSFILLSMQARKRRIGCLLPMLKGFQRLGSANPQQFKEWDIPYWISMLTEEMTNFHMNLRCLQEETSY